MRDRGGAPGASTCHLRARVGLTVGPVLEATAGFSRRRRQRAKVRAPSSRCGDVTIGFGGVLALDEVSMSIEQGEVVGVIGPNGAGKTTLFNVICGFVHPSSGHHQLRAADDLHRHHPHDLAKLGIARTLQGVGLCAGLTVLENVMLGARAGAAQRPGVLLPRAVAIEPGRAADSGTGDGDPRRPRGRGLRGPVAAGACPTPSRSRPRWHGR